jgi:hypothetical protein
MKNIFKNKKIFFIILLVLFFAVGFFSKASIIDIPQAPNNGASFNVYMKWIFDVGIAIGFFSILLALTVSGVCFILSTANPSMLSKAREWLSGAVTGFLILMLMYLVLHTIYPALTLFNFDLKFPTQKLQPPDTKIHGVYFYEQSGCNNGDTVGDSYSSSSNVSDINKLTAHDIYSVGIQQDAKNNIYYIALIYATQEYYGQCQYINPNSDCDEVELEDDTGGRVIPKSASIYKYNWSPSGTVTFYRNGSYNDKGGYLRLTASDIKKLYEKDLKELRFTGDNVGSTSLDDCKVPKDQQDCVMWDKSWKCVKKECPKLSGKNIGSIKIDGNYLVVLEADNKGMTSTYCQAYPKDYDLTKKGPGQTKWDQISNSIRFTPNYVLIIPIQKD